MGKIEAVIHTAEGEVKRFAGVSARFIVSHPRLSFWIGVGLGVVAGRLHAPWFI